MAVCPQEEGEGQTQEPDAGLKGWGSQAGRVPRGNWDVPPEGPGHPWGDGCWQPAVWSHFMLPSGPQGWKASLGVHFPRAKDAGFSTVQETCLCNQGCKDLSNPLP